MTYSKSPWCKISIIIFSVDAIVLVTTLLLAANHVTINLTTSMPIGLYQQLPATQLRRGDIVEACMPLWAVAYRRRIGLPVLVGPCPGHAVPVLKHVAALSGDVIRITQSGVSINGRLSPRSAPQRVSSTGAFLPHPYVGKAIHLRSGAIWLLNPDSDSFDSRYWGGAERVLSVARPLLTMEL